MPLVGIRVGGQQATTVPTATEEGLGNYGTDAARARKSDEGRDEMDEKDRKIAHFRMVARNRKLAELLAN